MPIINKTVKVELTRAEVEEILKDHFKTTLANPKVDFHIREEGGDPMDRYPGTPTVYKITVEGKHL